MEEVKDIVKNLMEQLYEAKGFDDLRCNPLERNIFEAEMKDLWEDVEASLALAQDEREEYEGEIEELKGRVDKLTDRNCELANRNYELADRNCELVEENEKLWTRIKAISKVVNDTWC